MKTIIVSFVIFSTLFFSCQHSGKSTKESNIVVTNASGTGSMFEIEFKKGSKFHYPVIAIWLETANGEYIQTLYISKSVATGYFQYGGRKAAGKFERGTRRRPATVPYWSHKRNVREDDGFYVPTAANPIPDAYTGPTPLTNFTLKSKSDSLLSGHIRVLLEVNQAIDFNDYWNENLYPNDMFYKSSGQPSLVYATDVIDLKSPAAEYEMKLIGHGHYSGATGELFSDVSKHTTALQIVKSVVVKVK
jgi:hypothetical protein